MKSLLSLLLILSMTACSTKNSESKDSFEEWKEMQSLHEIMADAFHPYKDSANLAPARELAKELMEQSSSWAEASLPERVNNDDMKMKLQSLKDKAKSFWDLQNQNLSDSIMAASLAELHDSFHKIQEGWFKAGKEVGHEEHH